MAISVVGTTENSGDDPDSGTWDLPAGWQVGDLLLVFWASRSGTKTITEDAAITEKLNTDAGNSDHGRLFVGYRYLQSGDSAPGWTGSDFGVGNSVSWGAIALRGGPTSGDPFEAASSAQSQLNVQQVDPPSVTTLTNGAWVITVIEGDDDAESAELEPPSGYTLQLYVEDIVGSDNCIAVATLEKATAGLEDPGVWGNFQTIGTDSIAWTAAIPPGATPPASASYIRAGRRGF